MEYSNNLRHIVVPHAGTWIEIPSQECTLSACSVVPHAGTWIEIASGVGAWTCPRSFPTRERGLKYMIVIVRVCNSLSFPTRERGLKYMIPVAMCHKTAVVPHAGTWIEM